MANEDTNVIGLTVLGQIDYNGFLKDFESLVQRIKRDDDNRAEWIDDARDIELQLRGETEREHAPWPDACKLEPPLTKKMLRRWIPVVFNLFAKADPLCHFFSNRAEAAMQAPMAEEFFTWLVRVYMHGTDQEVALLANGVGGRGQDYVAVDWDYHTELENRVAIAANLFPQGVPQDVQVVAQRIAQEYDIQAPSRDILAQLVAAAQRLVAGAPAVRVEYRRVVCNRPRIRYWPTERVIVPSNSGRSEEAEYVCLVHYFTPFQLMALARDDVLNAEAVVELVRRHQTKGAYQTPATSDQGTQEGIARDQMHDAGVMEDDENAPIRVHQVYCWLDKNGDGLGERVVMWYAPGMAGTDQQPIRLAVHDFPFSFKLWPVVRFDYEKVDRRPYRAQGIGQQLRAIQAQFTKQYRATADAIDIQLAPVFQMRATSSFQPRNIKWGPGKVIPVNQIGDIAPVEKNPFNLHEYIQDRGELKTFAEEMIGSVDSALAATGRQLERRTAFEVDAVSGAIKAMQGMDASLWQSSMATVLQIVWEMWLDLGPATVYYSVTGTDQPKPFTKSEYNKKYQLVPAGTPGNTDRAAELQRFMQLFQFLMQAVPDMLNRQFGAVYAARLYEPRIASQIILPQVEQQVMALLAGAAAQIAKGDVPEAFKQFGGVGAPGGGSAVANSGPGAPPPL